MHRASCCISVRKQNWSSTHSHCVDQADLRFTDVPSLCLLVAVIKGIRHHAWLEPHFLQVPQPLTVAAKTQDCSGFKL